MSYATNLLSRGEEIVFESRQHWFAVLAQTWIWIVVAVVSLAALIFLGTNPPVGNGTVDGILTIALLVILLASLGRIGLVLWAWRNQEFLVTTRRIIKSEGIFNKNMGDSSLEKVNDAHLSQSWLGRIFDYGTLDILTAADESGGIEDFHMLADPVKFKIAMLNQKESLERPDLAPPRRYQQREAQPEMRRAAPMPPRAGSDRVSQVRSEPAPVVGEVQASPAPTVSPPPVGASHSGSDLATTLERLGGLREKGLITDEEYDAKKRDILERM
jgi:Bacterial PH domain/Short C-terminal domain